MEFQLNEWFVYNSYFFCPHPPFFILLVTMHYWIGYSTEDTCEAALEFNHNVLEGSIIKMMSLNVAH